MPPEDKTFPGVNALAEQPRNDQKSSDVGQILETQQLLETSLLDASMYFVIDSAAAGGGITTCTFVRLFPESSTTPAESQGPGRFSHCPPREDANPQVDTSGKIAGITAGREMCSAFTLETISTQQNKTYPSKSIKSSIPDIQTRHDLIKRW